MRLRLAILFVFALVGAALVGSAGADVPPAPLPNTVDFGADSGIYSAPGGNWTILIDNVYSVGNFQGYVIAANVYDQNVGAWQGATAIFGGQRPQLVKVGPNATGSVSFYYTVPGNSKWGEAIAGALGGEELAYGQVLMIDNANNIVTSDYQWLTIFFGMNIKDVELKHKLSLSPEVNP